MLNGRRLYQLFRIVISNQIYVKAGHDIRIKPAFFNDEVIRNWADEMPFWYRIFAREMAKHEIIPCERCGSAIECKANSYTKCQCSVVQLTLNEMQYISEQHDGCLCALCLFQLQVEYQELFIAVKDSGTLEGK